MARVVRLHDIGGPDVLRIAQEDPGPLGPTDVLVDVHAIGVNRAEVLFREGRYLYQPVFPSRIGLEAYGVVRDRGPEARRFVPSQRVNILPTLFQPREGTYGDFVVVDESHLIRSVDTLDPRESASSWIAYLTAAGGLIQRAGVRRDDVVLVTAASSAVGLASIEVARAVGARVLATTRTAKKVEALLLAGAERAIATDEEDVEAAVRAFTDGRGVDVIWDPIVGPFAQRLIATGAPGVRYIAYGILGGASVEIPMLEAFSRTLTFRTYTVYETLHNADERTAAEDFVRSRLETGDFKPRIAAEFELDDVAEAHRTLEANEHIGKVVIRAAGSDG